MSIRSVSSSIRWRLGAGIVLGLLAGMAAGQNVTIPWPTVSYKGSVELHGKPTSGNCLGLYTVPTGLKLRITSLLLDSQNTLVPIFGQVLCGGSHGYCEQGRTTTMTVPVGNTLSISLTSGILFNPGETVYACNSTPFASYPQWALYGFLYR